MNFSKINQSKISQLEREYLTKIKGGGDPEEEEEDGYDHTKHPCYKGCIENTYHWVASAKAHGY